MKKIGIIGIISVLVLIVAMSGCTSSNSYSGNGVSFNYPSEWKELNVSPPNLVGVGDPNSVDNQTKNVNTVVAIQKTAIPAGQTLKQVYDTTYQEFAQTDSSFKTVSDTTMTVDGTTAYVNTHLINVDGVQKQEQAVWLLKNGYAYVILCGALPSQFSSQQANFNMIINSFKVT